MYMIKNNKNGNTNYNKIDDTNGDRNHHTHDNTNDENDNINYT